MPRSGRAQRLSDGGDSDDPAPPGSKLKLGLSSRVWPRPNAPSAADNAAVSEPSPTVEGWTDLSPTVRYGTIAAGVAVVGLLAFLLLRRKK